MFVRPSYGIREQHFTIVCAECGTSYLFDYLSDADLLWSDVATSEPWLLPWPGTPRDDLSTSCPNCETSPTAEQLRTVRANTLGAYDDGGPEAGIARAFGIED